MKLYILQTATQPATCYNVKVYWKRPGKMQHVTATHSNSEKSDL